MIDGIASRDSLRPISHTLNKQVQGSPYDVKLRTVLPLG